MNILIVLLILSLPFGVLTRVSLLPDGYIYLHDLIAGLIFLYFLYLLISKKIKIENKRILYLFSSFLFVGFISLLINSRYLSAVQFAISFLYLARYMVYGSLLFSARCIKNESKKLMGNILVISGSVFCLFGFIQYHFYTNLRNLFYAGWDDHLYRLFSTMFDPNFAGIFLVFIFILVLSYFTVQIEVKKYKLGGFYLLLLALSSIAIYLTYSRSAFLALLAGVTVFLIKKGYSKFILPAIIVLSLMMLMFANFGIEGLNPLRSFSTMARVHSDQETFEIALKNPVFGVGFDAFRYAQIRYGVRNAVTINPSNADAGSDNSYLFIAATTGIVGLVLFARYILEILRRLNRAFDKNDPIAIASMPTFVALLVDGLFINSLFYPLVLVWAFILIGVTQSKKR